MHTHECIHMQNLQQTKQSEQTEVATVIVSDDFHVYELFKSCSWFFFLFLLIFWSLILWHRFCFAITENICLTCLILKWKSQLNCVYGFHLPTAPDTTLYPTLYQKYWDIFINCDNSAFYLIRLGYWINSAFYFIVSVCCTFWN